MSNPIRYTSRDYASILNDMNNDPELANKPIWFKKALAGIADNNHKYIDAQANNTYLETIFTRKKMELKLREMNYDLFGKVAASGLLRFNIDPDNLPVGTIAKENLTAIRQDGVTAIDYGVRVNHPYVAPSSDPVTLVDAGTDTFTVDASNYYTGDLIRVGASGFPGGLDGVTNYYVIKINDTSIKLAVGLTEAYAGTAIDITSTGATVTVTNYALIFDGYQQKYITEYVLGTGDNTEWQEFDLADKDVISETILITIDLTSYTIVDNWTDSVAGGKNFVHRHKSTGDYIEFGDGTLYGFTPASDINISYAVGGGLSGNTKSLNIVNIYTGGLSNIVDVSNVTNFTGGSEEENIERARRLAPILLATKEIFIEEEDGEALTLAYGGVSAVKVNKNYYGPLTSRVVIVPSGGGTSSTAFKSALKAYLESKSWAEVTVIDATYDVTNFTSVMIEKAGSSRAKALNYYEFAIKLWLDPVGIEILDQYQEFGITTAISTINIRYSYSFDSLDYDSIESIIDKAIEYNIYARINETYRESDILAYLDDVPYVDYLTISAPTFPFALGAQNITSIGTITTT